MKVSPRTVPLCIARRVDMFFMPAASWNGSKRKCNRIRLRNKCFWAFFKFIPTHIFFSSSNCPQCRCPSTNNDLLRLYFNISSNASRLDFDTTANGIELLEKERMIIVLSQEAGRAKGEAKVLLNRVRFFFVLFVLASDWKSFELNFDFSTDRPAGETIAEHARRER